MEGTTTTGVSTPSENATPVSTTAPKITVGTSAEYAKGLEELTGRAFAAEPLTVAFASERLGISKVTPSDVASGHAVRIKTKLALGAEIVEAGNWAAAACWENPDVAGVPTTISDAMREKRPIFVSFLEGITVAKATHMPEGSRFWHLSMMGRDPGRKDKGAVRAVLEPYIGRAREEGLPIWIEAGSPRARDVYAYFGFRIVDVVWTGTGVLGGDGYLLDGGPGVPTWMMIKDSE